MNPKKPSTEVTRSLFTIPDTWAAQGQCPVCGHKPLQVAHSPNVADQMVCGQCGLSFEIENGGTRVRLKDLPSQLRPLREYLADQWMTMKEVSELLQRQPSTVTALQAAAPAVTAPAGAPSEVAVTTPEAAPPPPPLTHEELLARAKQLIQLGNAPQKVRAIFEQSQFPAEQIDEVMTEIVTAERLQREAARRTMGLMFAVAGVFVFVLVASGAVFWMVERNLPTATPVPTRSFVIDPAKLLAPFMPGGAANPIPSNLLPNSSAPTPGAQQGAGPAASKCPTSPNEAAGLFGGNAKDWKPGDYNGTWVLTSFTSVTIRIPAKMSAGYLRGGAALEMLTVIGPATLTNVNFVAITCE